MPKGKSENRISDCGCREPRRSESEKCCLSICELLKTHDPKFTHEQYVELSTAMNDALNDASNDSLIVPADLDSAAQLIKLLTSPSAVMYVAAFPVFLSVFETYNLITAKQIQYLSDLNADLQALVTASELIPNELICRLQKGYWLVVIISEIQSNEVFIRGLRNLVKNRFGIDLKDIIVSNLSGDPVRYVALVDFLCKEIEKLCIPFCVKVDMKNAVINTMMTYFLSKMSQKQVVQSFKCTLTGVDCNSDPLVTLYNDTQTNQNKIKLCKSPYTLCDDPLHFYDPECDNNSCCVAHEPDCTLDIFDKNTCDYFSASLCGMLFVSEDFTNLINNLKLVVRSMFSKNCKCGQCEMDVSCDIDSTIACKKIFAHICFLSCAIIKNLNCSSNV